MTLKRMSDRIANKAITPPSLGNVEHRHVLTVMAKLYSWHVLVEIGVRKAQTGLTLLHRCPELQWIGVDPWNVPKGSMAEPGFYDHEGEDREGQYRMVVRETRQYGDRAKVMRMTSAEASRWVPDHYADCVFIDGDHRYEFVCEDIRMWKPKVRRGGWLTGHDSDWDSVAKAIDTELDGYEIIDLPDSVWAVRL